MGTYFPMSEDQRDSGTMLYLRDPLPNSQTQTPVLPGNIMYMNFGASSGSYSDALASNSNCMDAQPIASDSNPSHRQVLLSFGGSRAVENMIVGAPGQGLSLTLGTHGPSVMQISPMQYQNDHQDFSPMLGCNTLIDRGRDVSFENEDTFQGKQSRDGDYMISSGVGSSSDGANDGTTYGMGMPSIARAVPNSKYLKVAQELLDEVVNVKQAIKRKESGKESKEVEGESMDGAVATATDPSGKATANSTNELSVAEKHELQNKLTKLLSMLDEVDRRYRQYYHQMQIVVSSFDVVAGSGASKPYTALALQTISRHFRCLRDAINVQIQTVRKSLGEEDATFSNKGVGISRLRFVDQQLRQQRALQQLGMMQHHAWRPQRGLPETSVSILRAWLFEHFLHPYPKDSDKIMLARQTGLTRSQVSNWFINARVRLWKPMVEEMYKEETGDADMDSNSSSETIPKAAGNATTQAFEDKVDDLQQSATTSTGRILESRSDQMTNVELLNMMQAESQNNYRTAEMRDGQRQNPFPDGVIEPSTSNDRFMAAAYHMSEMERFTNTGGVTLTLGLQQCEGGSPMAMGEGSHHGFVPLRDTDVYNAAGASDMGNEAAEFDGLDSSNRPHQFVSSLLPSFS